MIAKCAGIGPGGLIPSPAARKARGNTTAATTIVSTRSASPLAGWPIFARNGGLAPHRTDGITCIGIMQSVKNVTLPAKEGKSNRETKASEIAIATTDAAIPSPGCATNDLRGCACRAIIGGGAAPGQLDFCSQIRAHAEDVGKDAGGG